MAQIQFFPGYSWDNLPKVQVVQCLSEGQIIQRINELESEWVKAVPDMGRVTLDLGLLFQDLRTIFSSEADSEFSLTDLGMAATDKETE